MLVGDAAFFLRRNVDLLRDFIAPALLLRAL
jgi:hypothetical protein